MFCFWSMEQRALEMPLPRRFQVVFVSFTDLLALRRKLLLQLLAAARRHSGLVAQCSPGYFSIISGDVSGVTSKKLMKH